MPNSQHLFSGWELELEVNLDISIKQQVTMEDTVVVSTGLSSVINDKDLGKFPRPRSAKKNIGNMQPIDEALELTFL